jgi:hypothetical protein
MICSHVTYISLSVYFTMFIIIIGEGQTLTRKLDVATLIPPHIYNASLELLLIMWELECEHLDMAICIITLCIKCLRNVLCMNHEIAYMTLTTQGLFQKGHCIC